MELAAIQQKIYEVRGVKVMIDRDLAELYGVETRTLNQAVKRNAERFPEDFMFQLTDDEMRIWKSQIVMSNSVRMGLRRNPYAFTELGVAMLSSVLRSDIAIQINIGIMRAFVAMRQMMAIQPTDRYEQLSAEVKQLKDYVEEILTDQNDINEAIARLEVSNRNTAQRRRIGFIQD